MTFSIQASSILLATLFIYFFFYFVLLPTISVALFCRQLIKIQLISEEKSTNKIIKTTKKLNIFLKKDINNLCKKLKNITILPNLLFFAFSPFY